MAALAGVLLIAHGLVHLAVWLPEPKEDAPFDPRRSWMTGVGEPLIRALAITACVLFVPAGVLVLAGAGLGAALAIAGAAVSLVLVALTFDLWFVGAAAIDIAIIAIALSG
ncbi:MAG: hypothetical protein ACXWED_06500 [Solirubrobacterales bacterium]